MQRRNFLRGLAGILAAGVAPAIVAQPMRLWVPKGIDQDLHDKAVRIFTDMHRRNLQLVEPRAGELMVHVAPYRPLDQAAMDQIRADFNSDGVLIHKTYSDAVNYERGPESYERRWAESQARRKLICDELERQIRENPHIVNFGSLAAGLPMGTAS